MVLLCICCIASRINEIEILHYFSVDIIIVLMIIEGAIRHGCCDAAV